MVYGCVLFLQLDPRFSYNTFSCHSYLQASEEKHKLAQEAAREKEAILKELERTKDELRRSTRTAADAIESRSVRNLRGEGVCVCE